MSATKLNTAIPYRKSMEILTLHKITIQHGQQVIREKDTSIVVLDEYQDRFGQWHSEPKEIRSIQELKDWLGY